MWGQQDLQLQRAAEFGGPPPKGTPYSLPIPGSQTEGKSAVYRHFKFVDKPLLERLDPTVCHALFELRSTRHLLDKINETS